MLKRILVPVNGTDYSWRALDYACTLAQASGGSLVIVTVSHNEDSPVLAVDGDFMGAQVGNEVLMAANAIMAGKHIECSYMIINSHSTAEAILEVARNEKCDNIVLGTRALGYFEGLLKGSVSRVVLAEAKVPVTIVK